jgi:hypothetical protein
VYVTHRLIEVARGLIQTACTSLGVFFSSMNLTIASSKFEVILFSRKHERPPILIRIKFHVLPQTTTFKYIQYRALRISIRIIAIKLNRSVVLSPIRLTYPHGIYIQQQSRGSEWDSIAMTQFVLS